MKTETALRRCGSAESNRFGVKAQEGLIAMQTTNNEMDYDCPI
jgi:hypothetical protein